MKESFFDDVFAIIALVCTVISTIDWLLGPKWQEKSRSNFENYWLRLSDLKFDLFATEVLLRGYYLINTLAIKSRMIFIRIHRGKKSLFLLFVIPSLVWWSLIFSLNNTSFAYDLGAFLANKHWTVQIIIGSILAYLSIGGILYFIWLPLHLILLLTTHITLGLLALMRMTKLFFVVIIISLLDFLISYLIYLPSAIDFGVGWGRVNTYFPNTDFQTILKHDQEAGIIIVLIFIISFLPTGIHLCTTLFYVVLRVADKTAKPLAQLIILRISESKQGALTQITIGIGVLIKTTQEILKIIH